MIIGCRSETRAQDAVAKLKEETKNDMKEEMVKETKTKTTKNVTRQDEDDEEEAYLAAVRDEVNLLLRLASELHTEQHTLLLSITQSLSSLQRSLESVGVPQEESSRYHMSLSDAIQNTMKDLRSPYEAVRSLALTRLEQILQTQSKGPSGVSL